MRASAWGRTREWHSSATTTLGACEVASCYTGAVVFTAGKQVTGTPGCEWSAQDGRFSCIVTVLQRLY